MTCESVSVYLVIFLPSFKGLYIMLLEAKSFIVQHNVIFLVLLFLIVSVIINCHYNIINIIWI